MAHGAAPCERVAPLSGFRIGVTAFRRAEEQAELLRRKGASVVLAPVVCTRPFGDDRRLRDATDVVLARAPDVIIATTGIGIRSWFAAAESWGADGALRATFTAARVVTRGPKAAAALVAAGVTTRESEPTERLDRLVARLVAEGVAGRRIALQLYGEDVPWAVAQLRGAGADVIEVPVYRSAPAADVAAVHHLLDLAITGQLDAITFASAAAVRTVAALGDATGIGAALRARLSTEVVTACVGPVTDEAAAAAGFARRCSPPIGRLGLMVRTLARDLHAGHRHFRPRGDGHEVVLNGTMLWTPRAQVVLTDVERMLLAALAARPGAVLSRAALRRRVWSDRCGDATVDQGISRLRRALQPAGLRIDVVNRRGWAVAASEIRCPLAGTTGEGVDPVDPVDTADRAEAPPG